MTKSIPVQCAELRADFIEKALSPLHLRVMDEMVLSAKRAGDMALPRDYDGEDTARDLQRMARVAEMWTVTPEMQDLILHAAQSLPPQVLTREMLPSQAGWLFLPKPLFIITDIRAEHIPLQVLMWTERTIGRESEDVGVEPRVARGIVVTLFQITGAKDDPLVTGSHNTPPMTQRELARIMTHAPRVSLVHLSTVAFDKHAWTVDTTGLSADHEERARIGRIAMRSMHDERGMVQQSDGSWVTWVEGHAVPTYPEPIVQFLHSYFHFCASELSAWEHEAMPRSSAKWLRRLGIPNSPVTIIRLRRHAPGMPSGVGWTLTYRYVRRGHWRRQWYGSGADRHQEHIWIMPTIVGPEEGELRQRDVVNLLQK